MRKITRFFILFFIIINTPQSRSEGANPAPRDPVEKANQSTQAQSAPGQPTPSSEPSAKSVQPSSLPAREQELLSADSCTELPQGRTYNQASQTSSLEHFSSLPSGFTKTSNILYQTPQGWHPDLSMLDVFSVSSWQKSEKKRPVILYVHGGGNEGTDKNQLYRFAPKYPELFIKRGFVFVNANYRLFPSPRSPNTDSHAQVTDIARATSWVVRTISQFGGDPHQIILLGNSTGAHIVALLGTNPNYFLQEKVPLENVKGTISLDVPHYHIPLALQLIKGTYLEKREFIIKKLYGQTREAQLKMSPASYLANNPYVKPALLISSGIKDQKKQTISLPATTHYKNEMLRHGHAVSHFHFEKRAHNSLVNDAPDDEVNQVIGSFLDELLITPSKATPSETNERKRVFEAIRKNYIDLNQTPGAVYGYLSKNVSMAVGCGSQSLFTKNQKRPDAHTIFSIGSISKAFTGLVLAKMVKESKVTLSQPVSGFISHSGLSKLLKGDLKFQNLVTHTAGLAPMPSNLTTPRDIHGNGGIEPMDPLCPAQNYRVDHLIQCLSGSAKDPWARCQARSHQRGSYLYSNLGFGLLSYALQDQGRKQYPEFSDFYRSHYGVPLMMEGSFAQAKEINSLFANLRSKDTQNEDIRTAIELLSERFAGLHHYSGPNQPHPVQAPQPDMGMLAGAGEIKISAQSLVRLLRVLLGFDHSKFYSKDTLKEFHRELYRDQNHRLAYGIDISTQADGSDLYMKSGATQGSGAWMTWSPHNQKGLFVLINRNPSQDFFKTTAELYKKLSQ